MAIWLATGMTDTGNNLVGVDSFAGFSLYGAQTATSFGVEDPGSFRIIMQGSGFSNYVGNHPTTGVITSWLVYDLVEGVELAAVLTGFSIDVADFNDWVASGDDAEMQNAIYGGDDTIVGSPLSGDDVFGYGGNDDLRGGGGGDQINGGTGFDVANYSNSALGVRVNLTTHTAAGGDAQGDTLTSVENLTGSHKNDELVGNLGVNVLIGLRGDDALSGGGGADVLKGGIGHDTLTGGSGADDFIFNAPKSSSHSDTIVGFVSGSDNILLENAVFNTLGAGALTSAAFFKGANAHDANDRIIYNATSGELFYDDDGTGAHAKILIATLSNDPALAYTDILVI